MKKVCHVLNSLLPSGAETMLVNSADLWVGYEKHVLATEKELGRYAEEFEKAGYIVHHVYRKSFIAQHRAIQSFFKELQPGVVHIHRNHQEFCYAWDVRLVGKSIAIVRTVHSVFFVCGILRMKKIFERWLSRLAGVRYVAIGNSVFENEKKILLNEPLCIIDNWCDESKFSLVTKEQKQLAKKEINLSLETLVLVSVGNCSKVKNHMYIFNAILALKEKYADLDLSYFHVGAGVDEEAEKVFVRENGIAKYVRFIGSANPVPYYKVADLNVMSSLYEGVSISAIEAMISGIPCLLTNVEGLCDFKLLGCDDVYYSDLAQDAFSEKLEELYLRFKAGKLTVSEDLSNKCLAKYDRTKAVAHYLDLYRGAEK